MNAAVREYRVRVKRNKPSGHWSSWFEEIVFRVTAETNAMAAQMATSILENHHIWVSDGLEMTVEIYERRGGKKDEGKGGSEEKGSRDR